MAADCKSAGFSLRRFESFSLHHFLIFQYLNHIAGLGGLFHIISDGGYMYTVLLNCHAANDKVDNFQGDIKQAFISAGHEVCLINLKPGQEMAAMAKEQVRLATEREDVVVAAGGDGTVNLIAGLCHEYDAIFGIIPHGTFNYFAREHKIPLTLPEAVETVINGRVAEVSVGLVNDKVFINNASFGLYTKLIRDRERASLRFGRIRLVAVLSALFTLLGKQRHSYVKIKAREKETSFVTPLVFIGNNTLQLENLGLQGADFTKENKLALIIMRQSTRWEVARFFLRGLAKSLSQDTNLHEFGSAGFEIEMAQPIVELVLDGEIVRYKTPLRFRADEKALRIIVPREVER